VPREAKTRRARRTTVPGERQRAVRGSLTRQQVIEAAIDTIEGGGYQQMTIRSLAAALGVAPMTIYRHVRNKDDLLDEVADHLLAQSWKPPVRPDDWRRWMAESSKRFRDLLVRQPVVLDVYLRHPVTSPAAMTRMQATLDVLTNAGFDDRSARRAYASIHTYTIGFAALESSRAGSAAERGQGDRLERELATFTTPKQFADGLGYLLDGIEKSRPSHKG
jgi:TetR/AcrR family transcriptional regulator, tetracycline repressor protein